MTRNTVYRVTVLKVVWRGTIRLSQAVVSQTETSMFM